MGNRSTSEAHRRRQRAIIKKRNSPVKLSLLRSSREAALNAVQCFNNPNSTFRAESFIVLMVIAWTYLLHAHYREIGVEYRYFKQGKVRRRYVRTRAGGFKYWELEQCLKNLQCPLDEQTILNLRFLIGLRHEIVHHQSVGADQRFSSRYLACCLNFERYICQLFGNQFSLDKYAALTLQFRDFSAFPKSEESLSALPANVRKFVAEFDADLANEDWSSPNFRRKFLFVPITVGKRGQADQVIEFVRPGSELASSINNEYDRIVLREVERPKHTPTEVVAMMQSEGFTKFRLHEHTCLWQDCDAKNQGNQYGVSVGGRWFWYESWVSIVRGHCKEHRSK